MDKALTASGGEEVAEAAQKAINRAVEPAPRAPPAAETVRLYASDWAGFVSWCRACKLATMPAAVDSVSMFLQDAAASVSASTLARRLAAIADQHRQQGYPSPTQDPSVKVALRVIRRSAAPRRRRPAASSAQLLRMAAACPGDLAGLRDRALLLLLAAGGIGRYALVGLDAEAVHYETTGVTLTLHDRSGDSLRKVTVLRAADRRLCPARALEDWQRASDTSYGPLFRKIDRWGNLEHQRLGTDAVRRILAVRTSRVRLPRVRAVATRAAKPA